MTSLARADVAIAPADVEIRTVLDQPGLEALSDLWIEVWKPANGQPQVSAELMRAVVHVGGYAAGAYCGGVLVGGAFGFLGDPAARVLHSHLAGVVDAARGRAVGRALKVHQYGWAAERGLHAITWTFDPLQSRNAWFNLGKLGATPRDYLVDFYGEMTDGLNAGQGSDRLYTHWPVSASDLPTGRTAAPTGARELLVVGAADEPVRLVDDGAPRVLVGVPRDISALRAHDPGLGRAWRESLREVLGGLMARGAVVTGFTRDGQYVVDRGVS